MVIWTLETESHYTSFDFPIEQDKVFFLELAKTYIEESKPVLEKWRTLFLLRGEPMKHPDFFTIDDTDVIALSQKAVDNLKDFLKDKNELLPIETDAGRYYALNVLNYVDCLNKEESEYESTKEGIIVNYSLLEFDEDRLGENKIFKIPELPYQVFITEDIEDLCVIKNLKGLIFDSDVNLVWYDDY